MSDEKPTDGNQPKHEHVPDEDYLLRSIPPIQWNTAEDRPGSESLKSGKELSVDWSKHRTEEDFMNRQGRATRGHGLIRFKVELPRGKGLEVKHDPNPVEDPDNYAHTVVIGSSNSFSKCVKNPELVEVVRKPVVQ